jgi:hypothetical protein
MEKESDKAAVLHFGTFEVNLRSGELRRNGVKVRLQEQPFQILIMLLERPGDVVSREELGRKLWAADTFVDFDNGLTSLLRSCVWPSAMTPNLHATSRLSHDGGIDSSLQWRGNPLRKADLWERRRPRQPLP